MLNHENNQQPRGPESARDRAGDAPTTRPADREVPLKRHRTPAAIHAWLDGDLPEAAVRRGDMAKDVEFWHRINTEADERRRMRTPVHVYDQIMNALPQTTPMVITPWWRRPFALTPAKAAALGAALLAAGVAVAAWLLN